MGFENLFPYKGTRKAEEDASDELSPEGKTKRRFLIGMAALGASALIPMRESEAADFVDPSLEVDVPKLREWFKSGCTHDSWPSVQVRSLAGRDLPMLRWAHEPNLEDGALRRYANCFFIDGKLVSNPHVIEGKLITEKVNDDLDIAVTPLGSYQWSEQALESIKRVELSFDRRKGQEDLTGQLIHIPSLHEKRGAGSGNDTTITSGRVRKIDEDMISRMKLPEYVEDPETGVMIPARKRFLSSYIATIDSNNDGSEIGTEDGLGLSGSPLFTNSDVMAGLNRPSGIVWGIGKGKTKTFVFFHGPDVLVQMLDSANTVVSMELDTEKYPVKVELTKKVQKKLQELGFYTMEIDGGYGEGTKQSVHDFQRAVFREEERAAKVIPGVVDLRTWEKLFPEEALFTKDHIYSSV